MCRIYGRFFFLFSQLTGGLERQQRSAETKAPGGEAGAASGDA